MPISMLVPHGRNQSRIDVVRADDASREGAASATDRRASLRIRNGSAVDSISFRMRETIRESTSR
jgi:hypothetical protein